MGPFPDRFFSFSLFLLAKYFGRKLLIIFPSVAARGEVFDCLSKARGFGQPYVIPYSGFENLGFEMVFYLAGYVTAYVLS